MKWLAAPYERFVNFSFLSERKAGKLRFLAECGFSSLNGIHSGKMCINPHIIIVSARRSECFLKVEYCKTVNISSLFCITEFIRNALTLHVCVNPYCHSFTKRESTLNHGDLVSFTVH
jgi:hypothetical protein